MNQGQGCEYYDQGTTSHYEKVSAAFACATSCNTYGELPRIPVELLSLSTFRIRIAIARAAVVNVILMNRNN
jgi:hypothetical protein